MPDTLPQSATRVFLRSPLPLFVAAILVVGTVRFFMTVNGVADSLTRWSSMTAVVGAAILLLGPRLTTHRERWIVAFALIVPYMFVETCALGFTWFTGTTTIFHSPAYSLGTPLPVHFFGHIVGGVTWEPAVVWLALWTVGSLYRRLIRPAPV
jgi:hypothetical protein